MRNFLFWLIILMSVSVVNAQHTEVKGMVTDSITGEGLPYAAVILKGTSIGGATDGDGNFVFSIPDAPAVLQISYLGYDSKELQIAPKGKTIELYVRLAPSGITLNEVTVKPKREKYRKKDNPAVEFVRRLIDMRKENNPRDHDYYSYDHYEKMFFAKNDYTPKPKKTGKTGKFDFLGEFVDTLDNGITVLPVSEKEKIQTVYYRKSPRSEKRVVRGYKSSGIDEIFSSDGVQQFLGEVFRDIDIFKNDIPLFDTVQNFV